MEHEMKAKPDIYDQSPVYESDHFRLRLVSMDDAEELLICYGDPEAQKLFNADRCDTDFKFTTLEAMQTYIACWLDAYRGRGYVRYAIVDRQSGAVVGTTEIFGGAIGGVRTDYGVLRVDLRHAYETEDALTELLGICDRFFGDVNTQMFITKAIPEAAPRVRALMNAGYTATPVGDGGLREHYYMKKSP